MTYSVKKRKQKIELMAKPVLLDTPDEFRQVDVDFVTVPAVRF